MGELWSVFASIYFEKNNLVLKRFWLWPHTSHSNSCWANIDHFLTTACLLRSSNMTYKLLPCFTPTKYQLFVNVYLCICDILLTNLGPCIWTSASQFTWNQLLLCFWVPVRQNAIPGSSPGTDTTHTKILATNTDITFLGSYPSCLIYKIPPCNQKL